MSAKYLIRIDGCDDSTLFFIELDDKEAAAVHKIALLSKETSVYSCMPILEIHTCNEECSKIL